MGNTSQLARLLEGPIPFRVEPEPLRSRFRLRAGGTYQIIQCLLKLILYLESVAQQISVWDKHGL